jgi:uncharacterized iron-regulated membrane protein
MTPTPERFDPTTANAPERAPKRGNRRPVRRFLILTHRWISLVLGLILLLITTSGAVLLYRPELAHWMNSNAYSPTNGTEQVSFSQAIETVRDEHPRFELTGVVAENGILRVYDADGEGSWSVDPSTGEILGYIGSTPGWVAFLANFHECFLSCEGEPGYLDVLSKEVPKTTWLGFDNTNVTWGALVLTVFALMLLYVSLTGLWLWFPRPSKWQSAMNIGWKRGRFARDTDLHKVAGIIAIPILLMWGITGGGFEAEPFETAWYAATPGDQLEAEDEPMSKESDASDIGIDAAITATQEVFPDDKIVSVDIPTPDDPAGVYYLWLDTGFDPYRLTDVPGNRGVVVERHTGEATVVYGNPKESTAQSLWDSWSYPVHSGYIVNGWWRLVWLALALSPLLLAVTGLSTWLVRRSSKRARKKSFTLTQ